MSTSPRKRRAPDTADALQRVQELAYAASLNSPEAKYLDKLQPASGSAQPSQPSHPLLTIRQREKVVKYINEVRHRCRAPPPAPRRALTTAPARTPHKLLPQTRLMDSLLHHSAQLAEDFELCVQTGTLACNYFDRYVASVRCAPPAHPRARRP